MIDESMDKEAMKEEPKDFEFRSKPAYQRLLIMVGGVMVNFLLAFFLFWMILFNWGEGYIDVNDAKFGLAFHPVAHEVGLQDGDIVTAVDTFKVQEVSDISAFILLEEAKELSVKRGDSSFTLAIPEGFAKKVLGEEVKGLVGVRMPFVVDSILNGDNADEAGLIAGDSLVSINDKPAAFYRIATDIFAQNKGKRINLGIIRDGEPVTIRCAVSDKGKIGVYPKSSYFNVTHITYGFWEALPAGVSKGVNTLVGYVKQLKLVFTKEGAKQIGGFGAIGNLFPPTWDWYSFWSLTAFLSVVLAFMNILPIPALDGGHVLFLLYEIVSGRKPSEKFLEYAQMVGMVLLLSLLLFANGNDLFRWIF